MSRRVHFDWQLPQGLLDVAGLFRGIAPIYVVGGAVRDAVMGLRPVDFDLATSLEPEGVQRLLESAGYGVDITGRSFGVVRVRVGRTEFEIATFRRDVGEGRRPERVEFTSIEEDVLRRDLTINALFYDIDRREVVDLIGGLDDIRRGVVRTVGDPRDRFREDPLRVMRAIRFAARMGSELEPGTEAAMFRYDLTAISRERIRDEFIKGLAQARSTVHLLTLLQRADAFTSMFVGLGVPRDALFRECRSLVVQLALLLGGNCINDVEAVLQEHAYTREEVRQVTCLLRLPSFTPSGALRTKKEVTTVGLTDALLRDFVGFSRAMAREELEALIVFRPTVSGADLLAEGLTGRELGLELERREAVRYRRVLERIMADDAAR